VGADKDSEKRQRAAITAFARRARFEIKNATRFARDLLTQELGTLSLIGLGVFAASGEDLTDTSDPMKIAMRQIAGGLRPA
jgi:hypothetical protein